MIQSLDQEYDLSNGRVKRQPYGFVYDIYYNEDLETPNLYLADYEVFLNATVNDLIRLHINNQGGRMDILVQLVNAIRSTDAKVQTILEGQANSAAGALFLQGDDCMLGTNVSLMVHDGFFGSMDNSSKVYQHVEFTKKHNEKIFRDFYQDFLDDQEISYVLSGGDLWMEEEEIKSRLEIKAEATSKTREE